MPVCFCRSLNFDSTAADGSSSAPERLTRSKASLKEVTIEELDLQFVPPDVTPDLYDPLPVDDDYTLFLAETFGYPVTATTEDTQAHTRFCHKLTLTGSLSCRDKGLKCKGFSCTRLCLKWLVDS